MTLVYANILCAACLLIAIVFLFFSKSERLLGKLILSCLLIGGIIGSLGVAKKSYVQSKKEEPVHNAIAALADKLNDNDPRLKKLFNISVRPGRGDTPSRCDSSKELEQARLITQADRQNAVEIITALCKGNFSELQKLVDTYVDRPFALAKVDQLLTYCLVNTDSKYRLLSVHEYGFVNIMKCGPGNTEPEQYLLLQLWMGKPPTIRLQTKDAPTAELASQPSNLISPEGLLVSIACDVVESVNRNQAELKAGIKQEKTP